MNSIDIIPQNKCFSCRSCEQICPASAITFEENNEGFYYPLINERKCKNCGLCVKHCPVMSKLHTNQNYNQKSYVTYLKDKKLLSKSTSGGAFAGFAKTILNESGVVFGAAYNDDLTLQQKCAITNNDLESLKGSKYIASDTIDSYQKTKNLLQNGKKVLYTGTPCQIAGLKSYLYKDYENLLTIDLICHGVPSQKLFNKYIKWQEYKNHGSIIYCGFRDKDIGGWLCGKKIKLKVKGKTKVINGAFDPYYRSFLKCQNYRESCYTCPYASISNRPADITIGDFFEVNLFYKEIDRKHGVSLVITNTQKGEKYFDFIKDFFELKTIDCKEYLPVKGNLTAPSPRPKVRDTFYSEIDNLSPVEFWKAFEETHISYHLKFYFIKFASKMMPKEIKQLLKKLLRR